MRCLALTGILLAIMATGCVSFGGDSALELSRQFVELREGNYRIVKACVRGQAVCPTAMYINIDIPALIGLQPSGLGGFGIGFGNPALREQAMADLHANYPMEGPQVLVNIVEEFSTSGFLFFYREVKLTITADVVEFIEDA